jgi:hypothetical protein
VVKGTAFTAVKVQSFMFFYAVRFNKIVQNKPKTCKFKKKNILIFMMTSTCFESEGSSSGRRALGFEPCRKHRIN